ncbi:MAG: signal peptidase I, partial [Bdellovibrionota bacterium]
MKRSTRTLLRDYGGTVAVAVFVALVIRFFVIEAYRIPSGAMRPTLEPGDTIFVAKWVYGVKFPLTAWTLYAGHRPERGDVVVFTAPVGIGIPGLDYIKRIVAVGGDRVEIKKGNITLNGKPLGVPTKDNRACGPEIFPGESSTKTVEVCREPPLIEDYGPVRVPDGQVLVLGDLRSQTQQGTSDIHARQPKTWGIVPISLIKGQAKWIWL